MKPKLIPMIAWIVSASLIQADILVQELFDGISSGNATIDGAGNTATSIGLTDAWATHGNTGIFTADNFDVDGSVLPGLPSNGGASGGVWNNASSWSSDIYATRPLAEPIDFNTDREIFFSVRLNNAGDSSMGIGLAAGASPDDAFVGAGFSWNNARSIATGLNEAGNAAYISHGTLNNTIETVNGIADVIVDGVYGIRAFEPAGGVDGYGLLVGRIVISSTGDDVIQIKRYAENDEIANDLGFITWTATSTLNSSMSASHLVLWVNGNGTGQLDAIRIGETWTDVTGVLLAAPEQPVLEGANVSDITGTGALAGVNLHASPAEMTLYWGTVDERMGSWPHSNALGSLGIGPVTGALTGLSPDTRYFYRFHAVNTAVSPALEGWSEAGRSFVTSPAGKTPVQDLEAEPYSSFEVGLFWTDVFDTETGYVIQRSPAGAGEWVTVGTVPADVSFYFDKNSGLTAATAYDYRIYATNAAGSSAPSNVATVTTLSASALETQLLIHFNGSLDGTEYTLGDGEIDLTHTFKANGTPTVNGGFATINPGNEGGADGFDINPAFLGDLTTQNWVTEVVLTYQSTGLAPPETPPVVMDVQGDCNLRLRPSVDTANASDFQLSYWNGSVESRRFTPRPPNGTPVHLAISWDAATSTLTGYVDGVSFGSISGGPFATPAPSALSFGYFARPGFLGRGIDAVLDAVAFQAGTASFDPATGFLLSFPELQGYASWIGGFPVGGLTGFSDDADGDGFLNGIEAFLGTNPSTPNGGGITQVSTDGTVTAFTHPMANPPIGDVTGSYEWSTDLVNWYAGDGADGPSGGPTVSIPSVAPVAGTATVIATASESLGKIFIRIKATRSGN